jgi:hypothetical protein
VRGFTPWDSRARTPPCHATAAPRPTLRRAPSRRARAHATRLPSAGRCWCTTGSRRHHGVYAQRARSRTKWPELHEVTLRLSAHNRGANSQCHAASAQSTAWDTQASTETSPDRMRGRTSPRLARCKKQITIERLGCGWLLTVPMFRLGCSGVRVGNPCLEPVLTWSSAAPTSRCSFCFGSGVPEPAVGSVRGSSELCSALGGVPWGPARNPDAP